jgi:hypothetical protein
MNYLKLLASAADTPIIRWAGNGMADLSQGAMSVVDGNILVTGGGA